MGRNHPAEINTSKMFHCSAAKGLDLFCTDTRHRTPDPLGSSWRSGFFPLYEEALSNNECCSSGVNFLESHKVFKQNK